MTVHLRRTRYTAFCGTRAPRESIWPGQEDNIPGWAEPEFCGMCQALVLEDDEDRAALGELAGMELEAGHGLRCTECGDENLEEVWPDYDGNPVCRDCFL